MDGAAKLMGRAVITRVLGLIGTIILARLLTPEDFGIVAVGLAITMSSAFLSDVGLGALLVRREKPPSHHELQVLATFQVAVALAMFIMAIALAVVLGSEVAAVTALMLASLPLTVVRAPTVVLLERSLRFGPIARADVAEAVSYQLVAVALVVVGLGVWGICAAVVVRAVIGTLVLRADAGGLAGLRPRLDARRLREMLSVGVQFQAVGLLAVVRDQVLNLGIGLIGGLAMLGQWSLVSRMLLMPLALLQVLWRVSFPAIARLRELDSEVGPQVQRGIGVVGTIMGAGLTPAAACSVLLVPLVFGDAWTEAGEVVPAVLLAMMIGGSISTAVAGLLFAVGEGSRVVRAVAWSVSVNLVLALGLLPLIGLASVAIGLWVAAMVDTALLVAAARPHVGGSLVTASLPSTALALLVGGGLAIAALFVPVTIALAAAFAIAGCLLYAAGIWLLAPAQARESLRLVRGLQTRLR